MTRSSVLGWGPACKAPHCQRIPYKPLPSPLPRAANERTFLAWMGMATTLGTVSTAIAGFAVADEEGKQRGGIGQGTVEVITLTLLPVSILMIGYALFTFYWRSEFIRRKQIGFFDDKVGPIVVALVVMASLSLITVAAIRDLLVRR